ncbi:hypothetical protein V7S43_002473 [Phytophthora oleae]|uniref:MULE transposase domain-containing protein n=1 Tax=Phytophthora oleae TaxID=2107226 RepID=A0ABD3G5B3_9STRA
MVREMLVTTGRPLRPVAIQQKLKMAGITASYMNCVHALRRLHLEFFGSDAEQYMPLPSYIDELNRRGHKTSIELTGGVFKRVWIAFRESIEAYTPYHERGIAVDGTSLKTSIGGVLLVACFRNGSNEIQIVGIGVVAMENENNWT